MIISDMDAIDREIVRTVQHDPRISYRDLGRAVGLSPNAAADRLRRLLRSGVLQILAVVDPGADVRLRVLIDVQLRQDQSDDALRPRSATCLPSPKPITSPVPLIT